MKYYILLFAYYYILIIFKANLVKKFISHVLQLTIIEFTKFQNVSYK